MKNERKYNVCRGIIACLMILALLWLTISCTFTYASQQQLTKQNKAIKMSPIDGDEEESTNPFGNNNEEKIPNDGSPFTEEYLHLSNRFDYFSALALQAYKCEKSDTYTAFHGEILVPPPISA